MLDFNSSSKNFSELKYKIFREPEGGLLVVYNLSIASIFIDLMLILIVIKSARKLVLNEVWILISLTIFLIFNKVFHYFIAFNETKGFFSHKNYTCISVYSFLSLIFEYYFILLFYSLFHLSIFGQTKNFKILYRLTRSSKVFFVYVSSSFFFIYFILWLLLYFDQNERFVFNEKSKICKKYNSQKMSKMLLFQLAQIFLPITTSFVYMTIIYLILFKENSNKFLNVSIKFFLFSLFSSLMIIQVFSFIFEIILKTRFSYNLSFFIEIIAFFQQIFHSIILLLIHKILKKSLLEIWKKIEEKYLCR